MKPSADIDADLYWALMCLMVLCVPKRFAFYILCGMLNTKNIPSEFIDLAL